MSVVKALLDKYGTLTAANFPSSTRPAIVFGANVTGTAAALPHVVVKSERVARERIDAAEVMLTSTTAWEVYAATLADCDTIFDAVLFNGGAVGAGQGFEDGTLTLGTGYRLNTMHLAPGTVDRAFAAFGPNAERCHVVRFSLLVEVIAGSF